MAHTNETTGIRLYQPELDGSIEELVGLAPNQENGEADTIFGLDGARRMVRGAIGKAALVAMGVSFSLGMGGCSKEDLASKKPVPGLKKGANAEDGELSMHHAALTAAGVYSVAKPQLAAFDNPKSGFGDLDTKILDGKQVIFFSEGGVPSYVDGNSPTEVMKNSKSTPILGLDQIKDPIVEFAVSKKGKIIYQAGGLFMADLSYNKKGKLEISNPKKLPIPISASEMTIIVEIENGKEVEYLYWPTGNTISKVNLDDFVSNNQPKAINTKLDSTCGLPQMYFDKDGKTEFWLAGKGYKKYKDDSTVKHVCKIYYGNSFQEILLELVKAKQFFALNPGAYNNESPRIVGNGKTGEFVILLKNNGDGKGAHPYTAEILEYCGNDQCGDKETPQNCPQDCKVDDKDAGSTQPDAVSDKDAGSDASDTSQDAGSDAGVDAGTDSTDTSKDTETDTSKDTENDTGTDSNDTGSDTTDAGVDAGPDSADTSKDTETDTSKDTENDTGADSSDTGSDTTDTSKDTGTDSADTGSDTGADSADTTDEDTNKDKDTAEKDTTKPEFEPITVANKDCKISIKKTQKGALEGYRVSVDAEKIVESCLADIEVAGFKAKAQINAINKDGAIHMHCIFLKDGADVTCYGELDTLLDLDEDKHGIKIGASETKLPGVYTVSSASKFSSVLKIATDGSGDRVLVITPEEGDLNIFGGKFFGLLQIKAEDFKGIKLQINVDKGTIREGNGEEYPIEFPTFPKEDAGTQIDISAQTDAGAKPDQVNKTDGVAHHDGGTSTDTGYRKPPVDDGCSASLKPGQRSTLPMAIMSMLTMLSIVARRRKKQAEVK